MCKQHSRQANIGRPSKFTLEVRKRLLEAVRAGVYMQTAADYAGIGISTLHEWLGQGRADLEAGRETAFADFSEEIVAMAARVEVAALAHVTSAAAEDWRAAAWLAERRYPDRYGKRDSRQVEHAGVVGVDVNGLLGGRQPVQVPREARAKILKILEEGEVMGGTADEKPD